MVTKLTDGRGQVTVKGAKVTDDWEQLIRGAAKRNGQPFADFIVDSTTAAAQTALKRLSSAEQLPPDRAPVRLEDVLDVLKATQEQQAERDRQQAEAAERQRQEQAERDWATTERMERLERQQAEQRAFLERQWAEEQRAARRGLWRRRG